MNFFIFHGVYASPNANWFPWLKSELDSEGFEVIAPVFSTPLNQSLESWLRTMEKYESKINGETVLIGHSLGAAFILSFLEKTRSKIKAAYLVAGFHKPLDTPYDKLNKSFIDKKFDWSRIKNNCGKFYLFASDNDQYIPLEVSRELAGNVNGELTVIHEGRHLNKEAGFEKFPQLLGSINKLIKLI